jgi:heme/copper-type cytochrome/quinol oxidase subunit 2
VDSGPLQPGKAVELELRLERPGVYVFYCGIWCSPRHGEMKGTLIVTEA